MSSSVAAAGWRSRSLAPGHELSRLGVVGVDRGRAGVAVGHAQPQEPGKDRPVSCPTCCASSSPGCRRRCRVIIPPAPDGRVVREPRCRGIACRRQSHVTVHFASPSLALDRSQTSLSLRERMGWRRILLADAINCPARASADADRLADLLECPLPAVAEAAAQGDHLSPPAVQGAQHRDHGLLSFAIDQALLRFELARALPPGTARPSAPPASRTWRSPARRHPRTAGWLSRPAGR